MHTGSTGLTGIEKRLWWRTTILAVLLLAAVLRWIQPGLVEFKYDEVSITRQALGLVGGGPLPVLSGGTTLGIQRGALDVYLLALPLALLGKHIEAAVWGLAALGVIAVALTYVLGRRVGGPVVGLMAALFVAANPWLIAYDRKLWAHIQVAFSVLLAHPGLGCGGATQAVGCLLVSRCRGPAGVGACSCGAPGVELARRVPGGSQALVAARDRIRHRGRRRADDPLCLGAGQPMAGSWRGDGCVCARHPRFRNIGARRAARRLAASVLPVHRRRDKQPGRVDGARRASPGE